MQLDLRIWPCPALASVVLECDPKQMVLLPVVDQEVSLSASLRRLERDRGVELDDHVFTQQCGL